MSLLLQHISRHKRGVSAHQLSCLRSMVSAPAAAEPVGEATNKKFYDVPEAHIDSDLSQVACNIGLNRRRDLTIGAAGQIGVVIGGQKVKLSELFRDHLTVLFGVPDRGSVCSTTHVPGYLKEMDALRKQGVSQIICVSRGDASTVDTWGATVDPSGTIRFAADEQGALTRILGMEVEDAEQKSLRYAIALEDGIILKVLVDAKAGDVAVSSGKSMVEFLQSRPQAVRT